ncbi:MAG: DNA-3-methyladenine glycosylase I [Candidatus Marinimicrobia bacterium]|nr:DNA-3-methyladenine glycosylase I [Candidatus Neomarinimicrobiota bacterium]
MAEFKTYCEFVATVENDNVHRIYHDTQYGFPISDDNELFGRLILEINQAGLNWTTILNKQDNFRKAYSDFNIQKVASFSENDRQRLLSDAGIIRNKLKVSAAIHNAGEIIKLQQEHGSFKNWLDKNHPLKLDEWVKLFKQTFKFTGGEITNEFLTSSGYLKGAHEAGCSIYNDILKTAPMWNR